MAKRPALTDITSGFASNLTLNANNDAIETAFDNTLSRDGSSPNQMAADLDMGDNDIINVGDIHVGRFFLDGEELTPETQYVVEEIEIDFGHLFIETEADAEAAEIPVDNQVFYLQGKDVVGDFHGDRKYKKVVSEPTHEAKIHSTDGAWWENSDDWIFPEMFGAKGDDSTDDTAAFQDAQAYIIARGGGTLVLHPRALGYRIAEPYNLKDDMGIMAVGAMQNITGIDVAEHVITIHPFQSRATVKNLRLLREGTATGGCGIYQGGTASACHIENVHCHDQLYGFRLSNTDFARIDSCRAYTSVSHGFYFQAQETDGNGLQWSLTGKNLSVQNGGVGYLFNTLDGITDQVPMGDVENCSTYFNGSYGMAFIGYASNPLQGIRLKNCFIGDDAVAGIYMDTHGSRHRIADTYIELVNSGSGIVYTANNTSCSVQGCYIEGCDEAGVKVLGNGMRLIGNTIANNGVDSGASGGNRSGIYNNGNSLEIIANEITNHQYSLYSDSSGSLRAVANNFITPAVSVLFNNGGNHKFVHNKGFVSENGGAISLTTDGSGSVSIPHGLAVAPSVYTVIVSGGPPFAAFAVTAVNGTNIVGTCYDPATGSTINSTLRSFVWSASLLLQ